MRWWSANRVWLLIVMAWLLLAGLLSVVADSSKEQTSPITNHGLPEHRQSVQAQKLVDRYFPSDEGIPLFVVLSRDTAFTEQEIMDYSVFVEKVLESRELKAIHVAELPPSARQSFVAEDAKTFFVPGFLTADLDSHAVMELLDAMKADTLAGLPSDVQLDYTGPAGIMADTSKVFSSADVVLILATVAIIFLILIVIYRSLLLAILPLIGAGIAYAIVDRLLGLMGQLDLFVIEKQALSIMMVLLFAVITDYSLLLFSRFKENLLEGLSVHDAMKLAVRNVTEPILFSGGTVLMSMLTLFFASFESYRNFAPVFAIAVGVMIAAGLTLMPALFALAGTKAFWPFRIEKHRAKPVEQTYWGRFSLFVTTNPKKSLAAVMLVLAIGIAMISPIKYTFNLLDSFPREMSSVKGYQKLSDAFSAGDVSPGTLIVESSENLSAEQLRRLAVVLKEREGVASVHTPQLSDQSEKVAKLTLVPTHNPYTDKSFMTTNTILADQEALLQDSGIKDAKLWIAGDTAVNSDTKAVSAFDEQIVMMIVALLILFMLLLQTRSWIMPIYMLATILLSYGAALGITVFVFQNMLGYEGLSYRIPLYTFLFIVALGVDYSIMLVARIREEQKTRSYTEAVRMGLAKTGGVISSAGFILAATFTVLMTQPVVELRAFGFAVAAGVLLDTFLVRPIALPALMMLIRQRAKHH
ncbi:MMPL family transporter [Paenibacillus sp. PAMC21692]|uniref:MMPL family transporter n=1 Tax=Paenibacillus sp. PAMC21692 TaxID=2762320 RepID=UPI00164E8CC1|nr:MMPL family transporter [Paenibacillus sp. PAMC21692]QNK60268.1 MMPL family transporter [Paenibacillus sp. PAMC21692]